MKMGVVERTIWVWGIREYKPVENDQREQKRS